MNKIIIVDDQPPGRATIAYWIAREIEELTEGEYSGELLEGVVIADALPAIKKQVRVIRSQGDTVAGLLVDFVDETSGVTKAGELLLQKLKSDPELSPVPVVIYTSRQTPDFSIADLKKKGAKGAIRRQLVGSHGGQLGKQVLDAFEITYKGGTNSTGPKDNE
jgi:hypothetical protein